MPAKRYLIRGRVQGVGYRYFAQHVAQRLGVNGFARNLPNGEVEVRAEAETVTLHTFKEELRRGPGMAHVTEIVESDLSDSGAYSSFLIRG